MIIRVLRGKEVIISSDRAERLPEATALALYGVADAMMCGSLKRAPFDPSKSSVVTASYGEMIVGVIVYSQKGPGTTLYLEYAWVDPGIRRHGVFRAMMGRMTQIVELFGAGLRVKEEWTNARDFEEVLERVGFHRSENLMVYAPFASPIEQT